MGYPQSTCWGHQRTKRKALSCLVPVAWMLKQVQHDAFSNSLSILLKFANANRERLPCHPTPSLRGVSVGQVRLQPRQSPCVVHRRRHGRRQPVLFPLKRLPRSFVARSDGKRGGLPFLLQPTQSSCHGFNTSTCSVQRSSTGGRQYAARACRRQLRTDCQRLTVKGFVATLLRHCEV